MTPLCEIAHKHETDKRPDGHNYTPIYYHYFHGMEVKKFLEIGVGGGHSMKTWDEYFPADTQIWGADNSNIFNEGRVTTIEADYAKDEGLEKIVSVIGDNIDIIVEDADHQNDHQIYAAKFLCKYLRVGGLYIIEDIQYDHRMKVYTELYSHFHPKFRVSQIETGSPTSDSRLVVVQRYE